MDKESLLEEIFDDFTQALEELLPEGKYRKVRSSIDHLFDKIYKELEEELYE